MMISPGQEATLNFPKVKKNSLTMLHFWHFLVVFGRLSLDHTTFEFLNLSTLASGILPLPHFPSYDFVNHHLAIYSYAVQR